VPKITFVAEDDDQLLHDAAAEPFELPAGTEVEVDFEEKRDPEGPDEPDDEEPEAPKIVIPVIKRPTRKPLVPARKRPTITMVREPAEVTLDDVRGAGDEPFVLGVRSAGRLDMADFGGVARHAARAGRDVTVVVKRDG
jgi:hypothetical protein